MDPTTRLLFAILAAWGVVILIVLAILGVVVWRRRSRSRPAALQDLQARIQERRESLRRAAATEYGRRSDRQSER